MRKKTTYYQIAELTTALLIFVVAFVWLWL
jgi:hypothetical protein